MSVGTALTLDFGDSTYMFRLPIGLLGELENICECGAPVILARLYAGEWRTRDVAETIRLALIGGGLTPPAALKLVRTYVHDRPWAESVPVARAALLAAITGIAKPEGSDMGEPGPATVAST